MCDKQADQIREHCHSHQLFEWLMTIVPYALCPMLQFSIDILAVFRSRVFALKLLFH